MPGAAVADDAGELAVLLAQLVAFPTESRTPNLGLIRWVADHVESNGGRALVLDGPDGRANLVASFGPELPGGLMLSGHTDVVPAGTGWATDPYTMTKVGNSLVGRGTADMKGFIAATIRAMGRFSDVEMKRPLHIALSFDEEIGCVGVRDALQVIAQRDDMQPDVVVIGEPTMMRPRHSHMGKLAYEVVCTTQAAHSSLSHSKPNAIAAAVRLLSTLDDLATYHPLGEPEVTFNCGSIAGGTALNVIAARCAFTFEVRHTLDHDPDAVLEPLRAAIDRERAALSDHDGSVDVTEITRYPALRTASNDPWLNVVERIADTGPATSIGYGTEGGLFAQALDVSVVICGPGDIAVAHRPDEYVTIDQLLRCERFICSLVQQICVDPAAEG